MQTAMKNEGTCQKGFSLSGPPPRLYKAKSGKQRKVVPVFEPYQEALPLESGFYTFVLDERGRFRVERGNTSSHSGMVGGEMVGAAGHFWIARSGKVGKVVCTSRDYRFHITGPNHPTARFVIDAFHRHQAFDVSPHAIFQFSTGLADSFRVSPDGVLVEDETDKLRMLDEEGQGKETGLAFSPEQLQAFESYIPPRPPRLYSMQLDHLNDPIDYDPNDPFEVGPFKPRYSPADGPLTSGRKAFVFDDEGWVIVGFGHHLLSGGQKVGAAGQIYVDEGGEITEVNLNFSGHYRPPLDAQYARYAYRTLIGHPLLSFAPNCRISARKYFDLDRGLQNFSFTPSDLLSDDIKIEYQLGELDDDWWDSESDDEGPSEE